MANRRNIVGGGLTIESSNFRIQLKTVVIRGAIPLALAIGMGTAFTAKADHHYFSLKEIFSSGKCSSVIPNYELLIAGFVDGQITKLKNYDAKGNIVETISILINKDRDQWAIVGSQTDRKVIFCLYSSGVGEGSVDNKLIE